MIEVLGKINTNYYISGSLRRNGISTESVMNTTDQRQNKVKNEGEVHYGIILRTLQLIFEFIIYT